MIFQFLYEFAAKERLSPSEGRHILNGRAVNELKLQLDKGTFFFATNSDNVHELIRTLFPKTLTLSGARFGHAWSVSLKPTLEDAS